MSSNYWSATPFISHDGPDKDKVRAEVRVKKGYGLPISKEDSEKGNASKFTIDTGHPKWKSSGWIPKNDPLYPIIEKAIEDGECLEYRIENKRKPNVDRTTPMAELLEGNTKDNITNSIVALKKDDGEWVRSPLSLTRVDEDPNPGGYSANDFSLEELRGSGGNATGGGGAPTDPSDPGSTAVQASIEVLDFVQTYYKEMGIADVVDEAKKFASTKIVLRACNDAQVQICEGLDRPDLGAYSHQRAREILFLVIRHYVPLTADALNDKDGLKQWEEEAVKKAVGIWKWSLTNAQA